MTELNKTQILLAILILLIVGYIVFPKQSFIQGISVRQLVDSIRAHDAQRDKEITILRIKYSQDSFRLSAIQKQLEELPVNIKSITTKYDNKKHYIDTSSADEQSLFFATWISKEGE